MIAQLFSLLRLQPSVPLPQDLLLSLTNRCNYKCEMCDVPLQADKPAELKLGEIFHLLDQAKELGMKNLILTGGEPLLRPDVFEVIAYAHTLGLRVHMPSNGSLLTETVAKKLRDAGISSVNISIDGPKEIQDRIRGPGAFEKALRALRNLKQAGIASTVAMTIMRSNYQHVPFIAHLAHQEGATTIKLQPFSPEFLNQNRPGWQRFMMTEAEAHDLEEGLKEAIRVAEGYRIAINPRDYLLKIPYYFQGMLSFEGCQTPNFALTVQSNGDVHGCWFMGGVSNVRSKSLLHILKSGAYAEVREKALKAQCPGCMLSCYDANTYRILERPLHGEAS